MQNVNPVIAVTVLDVRPSEDNQLIFLWYLGKGSRNNQVSCRCHWQSPLPARFSWEIRVQRIKPGKAALFSQHSLVPINGNKGRVSPAHWGIFDLGRVTCSDLLLPKTQMCHRGSFHSPGKVIHAGKKREECQRWGTFVLGDRCQRKPLGKFPQGCWEVNRGLRYSYFLGS